MIFHFQRCRWWRSQLRPHRSDRSSRRNSLSPRSCKRRIHIDIASQLLANLAPVHRILVIQMIRAGPDRKIGVVCDQRNACCSCYFHTKLSFLVFAVFLLYWPLSYAKSGNPALSIITAVLIEGFDFVDIVGVSVKESRFLQWRLCAECASS